MRKWHELIPRFVTSTLLLFSTPASIPEIFQINITVSLRSKDYGSRQHLGTLRDLLKRTIHQRERERNSPLPDYLHYTGLYLTPSSSLASFSLLS